MIQISDKQSILRINQYVLFVINLKQGKIILNYGEWGWNMNKKKLFASFGCAIALYNLVGCSHSTNAGVMAAGNEKSVTNEKQDAINEEENYELGEIKITNKERNKE